MPRDYKHSRGRKGGRLGRAGDSALSFLSGLSIGLLVAFAVFLYQYLVPATGGGVTQKSPPPAAADTAKPAEKKPPPVPAPTFDFYKILPNREVNLSEWVADEPQATAPKAEENVLYILQVGSFKSFEAADEVKARLALLGIDADIQRVVINGQDIRHRVRIGPFKDPEKFEATRKRLVENHMNFMVLRLKEEAQASAE